jgi:hypothetical protein
MTEAVASVKQPYWIPYSGYFRLFQAAGILITGYSANTPALWVS